MLFTEIGLEIIVVLCALFKLNLPWTMPVLQFTRGRNV